MKLLSVGNLDGLSNTCLHRHWALKKAASHVDEINTSPQKVTFLYRLAYRLFQWYLPVRLPDIADANKKIKKLVENNEYDIVWIDKGIMINASTLRYIKSRSEKVKIVSFTPDNMVMRHNQSQNFIDCIKYYDIHITTKSFIISKLYELGAREVLFTNKSFSDKFHYPRNLSEEDTDMLAADVGFVGVWEKERCNSVIHLAKNGINVRVFGAGRWKRYKNKYPNLVIEDLGLFSEDYPKSFRAFKISLCFLRKINYDLQTARTMEIPACEGFMMAERSIEHEALFEDGKEVVFFSDDDELLEKCKYYLKAEKERIQIAKKGRKRCLESGYSNEETIKKLLNKIF